MPATAQKIVNRPAMPVVARQPVQKRGTPGVAQPAGSLKIFYPADPAEREAEQTAKRIMKMPMAQAESAVTAKSSPHAARFANTITQREPMRIARKQEETARTSANAASEISAGQSSGEQTAKPTTSPSMQLARPAVPLASDSSAHPTPTSSPAASTGARDASPPSTKAGGDAPLPATKSQIDPGAGADFARIASASPSALQTQALLQAQLIIADCARSEVQVSQLAAARRQGASTHLAGVRATLSAFFARSAASVQALVLGKEVALIGAATRALTWVRTTVGAAVRGAQSLGERVRTRINGLLDSVTSAAQERVSGVASQITGLIESVPLPDLPGIARIRGVAVSLLNQGAGVVRGALGTLMGFVRTTFNGGMRLLNMLLGGFAQLADAALALVSSALLNLMQMLAQALNRALVFIVSALGRLLNGIVMPMLTRFETMIVNGIARAKQHAIAMLRGNRKVFLAALAEAVAPAHPRVQAGSAPSEAELAAAIRQLGQDAMANDRSIVQGFDVLTGGAFAILLALLGSTATRVLASVSSLASRAMQTIEATMTQALASLGQLAQAAGAAVLALAQTLGDALASLADYVGGLIQGGARQLGQFAGNALARIGSFVRGIVRALIGGSSGGAGVSSATGTFSLDGTSRETPSALFRGPIVKPSPGPILIIIKLAFSAIVVAVGALMTFLFGAELAAIIMANPVLAIAILIVLSLLLLLFLWLLSLLFRLLKPRPPTPGKRVLRSTPSVLELGVGGRDINATATIAPGSPARPALAWTINPGGAAPAGVSIRGRGLRVTVRAAQPPHGTVVGGTPITVRAALASNPADFADSAPVMMVQVLSTAYAPTPPFIPIGTHGTGPANTAEPNRDGISGNTAAVNAITAPATRPITVSFRRTLGATVAGNVVTPGRDTGDLRLRIEDTATLARLHETAVNPATSLPWTTLVVNPVPLRLTALGTTQQQLGPYGVRNSMAFASSDSTTNPLNRIVGELVTMNLDEGFNRPPPNGGFNPAPRLDLAGPANRITDSLVAGAGVLSTVDGRISIDVNRFVGPGVPQLPRRLIFDQGLFWFPWTSTALFHVFSRGIHRKTLLLQGANFSFRTEHIHPTAHAPAWTDNYAGPPLIAFNNVTATPTALGATALAADSAATANLGVTSSVAGRSVNWFALGGGLTIVAGNPAVLPATATLRAGTSIGSFGVRAEDTIYANRRLSGNVRVVSVSLTRMRANPANVPSGTVSSSVTLNANPGGRTINWSVDAAGVTVTPNVTGPGPAAMTVTVTRPAGFTGSVTVTATDSVLATQTASTRIRFR